MSITSESGPEDDGSSARIPAPASAVAVAGAPRAAAGPAPRSGLAQAPGSGRPGPGSRRPRTGTRAPADRDQVERLGGDPPRAPEGEVGRGDRGGPGVVGRPV